MLRRVVARRLLIAALLFGCGRSVLVHDEPAIPDGGLDADTVDGSLATDATTDATPDATPDATDDGGFDASEDACCRDAERGCVDDLVLEFTWSPPDGASPVGSPVVGGLRGGGAPELAFLVSDGDAFWLQILDVLDPDGGVRVPLRTTMSVEPRARLAIGDVDMDGDNEVVVVGSSWWPGLRSRRKRVIAAFNADGSREWRFVDPNWSWGTNGSVSIADLDADGEPEVVLGSTVLRGRDGALLSQGPLDASHGVAVLRTVGPTSCVGQTDDDERLEIAAGRTLFEADGEARWNAPFEDGFCGVADFLPRAGREVLLISDGYVRILDGNDGSLLWQKSLVGPARGTGTPPTIANFDDDVFAEFVVTAFGGTAIYDPTCIECVEDGVLHVLPDNAFVHGAFDFNLDGVPELLSAAGNLRVFDVTRSMLDRPRYSVPTWAHTSHAIVADVDADGEAEIVAMGFERSEASPRNKLLVWGHAEHGWPHARPIWNQGNFDPSQVTDDATPSGRSEHAMLRATPASPREGAGTCIEW